MKTRLLVLWVLVAIAVVSSVSHADDPFGGGFALNVEDEIFILGTQDDSLGGWMLDWESDLDSIYMVGNGSFPGSYQCGQDRDIAAADFNNDLLEDLVLAWNRADGGIFVGIPTIDPGTLAPDPAGWHVPAVPISAGVLYATDTLADVLGEIRLVAGNFYPDPALEFVLAYLAVDSTVTLTVFDVDPTLTPEAKGSISDQAIHTTMPDVQKFGTASRFDVAAGDLDNDGTDELVLVASDPSESPEMDLQVSIYDYDTASHIIIPVSQNTHLANLRYPDVTCLRRIAATTGDFDSDSLAEVAFVDDWARTDMDTLHYANTHFLDFSADMLTIADDWDWDSTGWAHLYPRQSLGDHVIASTVYNGDPIVGGWFTAERGGSPYTLNRIARWDGFAWRQLENGVSDDVYALAVYDGDLIAGGDFVYASGVTVNRIARWDGTAWHSLGSGVDGRVRALTVYNGDLIAGGYFNTAGGSPAPGVARWDGTSWHAMTTEMNDPVVALTVWEDSLIVGGEFTSINNTPFSRIACWDGSWKSMGTGANGTVIALTVFEDDLIAAGRFTQMNDQLMAKISRFDGTEWSALGNDLVGDVYALASYHDAAMAQDVLVAGGELTGIDPTGVWYYGLAWYSTLNDFWSHFCSGIVTGTGADEAVLTVLPHDGDLLIGGRFESLYFSYPLAINAYKVGLIRNVAASASAASFDTLRGRCDFTVDITSEDVDMAADSADEIVFRGYRDPNPVYGDGRHAFWVFGVDSNFDGCYRSGNYIAPGLWATDGIFGSRRTMAVGDFVDDVNHNKEALLLVTDTLGGCRAVVQAWDIEPDTFLTCGDPGWANLPLITDWTGPSNPLAEMVAADLDTATVIIGPPAAYRVDSVIQPLAIINAPPVHYDIINDSTFDVNNRYDEDGWPPPLQYDTYVDYYNSTGFSVTTETEIHRDWGVSAGLETWASVGGFNVSAYLEAEYGEGFSEKGGYSKVITIGSTVDARTDDKLRALVAGYDILEYPVYRLGALAGHVVVVNPDTVNIDTWKGGRDYDGWTPDHEVENVLSYPAIADIGNNYMVNPLAGGIASALQSFVMDPGQTSEWYLGYNTLQSSDVATSWDFATAVGASFGYEGGFKLFGMGMSAGFEVSVDAEYSEGQISTYSTTFSDTDSLHLLMGYITGAPDGPENRKYDILPYAYWARNGALVLDFATSPRVNAPGEDSTWWQSHYSNPDPAFLLPGRLDPEKWETTPDDNRYRTKEIAFIPSKPAPGDTVLIVARVHNLSLTPTPDSVKVSFYLGDPDFYGEILKDKNSGDSVFLACDTLGQPIAIEARGEAYVEMVWQVPDVGSISGCQRIWALIDPLDEISPEVHDNDDAIPNNKGWKLLYVATDNICIDSDGDGYGDPAFRCHECPGGLDNCPMVYNDDQADANGDGIGDACQGCCGIYTGGITGNANCSDDGKLTLSDISRMIDYLYISKAALCCYAAGNTNGSWDDGDCKITLSDISKLIDALYISKQPPADCMPECERQVPTES